MMLIFQTYTVVFRVNDGTVTSTCCPLDLLQLDSSQAFAGDERRLRLHHKACLEDFKRVQEPPSSHI